MDKGYTKKLVKNCGSAGDVRDWIGSTLLKGWKGNGANMVNVLDKLQ